jgi:N-acetylglucosaminyl-diphospho-decaprenol L-rhamnosyltransferase
MADLTVSTVNYRSGPALAVCLETLVAGAGGLELEIVVVDNGSDDGSLDLARRSVPVLHVLGAGENIGFAAGHNLALAATSAPWILMVNPDARLVSGDLATFVGGAERDERVGLAGPRLTDPHGALIWSQRRRPTVRRALADALGLSRLADLGVAVRNPSRYERRASTAWLSGAVLLVRRAMVRDVGPLDDQFFLYWEETDWCLRAGLRSWEVEYLPEITFEHDGGTRGTNPALFATYVESHRRFVAKHCSRPVATAHSLVMALDLGIRTVARGRSRTAEAATVRAGLHQLVKGGLALSRGAPP